MVSEPKCIIFWQYATQGSSWQYGLSCKKHDKTQWADLPDTSGMWIVCSPMQHVVLHLLPPKPPTHHTLQLETTLQAVHNKQLHI